MVDQVRRMILKGLAGLGAGAAMMPLMPTRVMDSLTLSWSMFLTASRIMRAPLDDTRV